MTLKIGEWVESIPRWTLNCLSSAERMAFPSSNHNSSEVGSGDGSSREDMGVESRSDDPQLDKDGVQRLWIKAISGPGS